MRLNDETQQVEWHRALRYTVKDGVIYDVGELLADVRALVARSFTDEPAAEPPAEPAGTT
jgi:imidazolonepropionase